MLGDFFCEGEKTSNNKNNVERERERRNYQYHMTGQTRCCMLHRREQVKNYDVKKKKRKNVENRTSSLLLTNIRTTTSNKPSNNRPFDCDVLHSFFVLCSLVMSCPFYSFFLVLVHDFLPLTSPSPVRYSQLALCFFFSLYTCTRSVYKAITKRKRRTGERENSVVINGHFTH